jgi:surfeit locus 1 family protein
MGQQPYSGVNPRARYIRSAIATLTLVSLLAVFIAAGLWQLGRAGEKHDLIAAFSAGSIVITVKNLISDAEAADYRFRRFELTGRFDPERHILLDNIVMAGRTGYQVLTPFYTGGKTVLVNRGWVPADVDRSKLPTVNIDDDERTITAILNRFPVPGMRMDMPQEFSTTWPRRMLYPTRDELAKSLGEELPDYQLQLDKGLPGGFARDWKPLEIGPEKNYGYAFQWFAFALLTLIFYVILNLRWNRQHKDNLRMGRYTDQNND